MFYGLAVTLRNTIQGNNRAFGADWKKVKSGIQMG